MTIESLQQRYPDEVNEVLEFCMRNFNFWQYPTEGELFEFFNNQPPPTFAMYVILCYKDNENNIMVALDDMFAELESTLIY